MFYLNNVYFTDPLGRRLFDICEENGKCQMIGIENKTGELIKVIIDEYSDKWNRGYIYSPNHRKKTIFQAQYFSSYYIKYLDIDQKTVKVVYDCSIDSNMTIRCNIFISGKKVPILSKVAFVGKTGILITTDNEELFIDYLSCNISQNVIKIEILPGIMGVKAFI